VIVLGVLVLDPFFSRALLGGTKKSGMSAPITPDHENVLIHLSIFTFAAKTIRDKAYII
jgi:hypothetical protein